MQAHENPVYKEELEHALTSLLRISEKLNSTFDLHSLLDTLIEEVLEMMGAESGCAGLRTSEGMSCDHLLHGNGHCSSSVFWQTRHGVV